MSAKPQKGELVEVIWRDACALDIGWTSRPFEVDQDDADEMQLHKTVGYVLQWDRKVVALTQSMSHRRDVICHDYVFTIPPKMVESYRVLRGAR